MPSYARRDFTGAAAETTLSGGINSTATTITITSGTGWPTGANGEFYAVIDPGTASEEKILVESRSGTTLTLASSAKRGVDDTSAASHDSGATIRHCYSADDADEANYWVAELSGAYDTAGDLAVADGNNSLATLAKGSNSTVLQVSSGGTLQYGTITSAMIADGTIVGADIANDAIDSQHYAAGSIDNEHLAANSVDSDQYVDGSIDGVHIAIDAIDSQHYAAGSIDEEHLADQAVTAAKIASAVAGDGLAGGAGTALSVTVDDSTLAIVTDTVKVKDAGITGTQIATSVAGDGLTGGGGSALAVGAGTGITVNANDVAINSSVITLGAWSSFTPTWYGTSASAGNATHVCRYTRIGRTIIAHYNITVGSTSTFSTANTAFGLPVTANDPGNIAYTVGNGTFYDGSTDWPVSALLVHSLDTSNDRVRIQFISEFTDANVMATLTASAPVTVNTGDVLHFHITYEAAS